MDRPAVLAHANRLECVLGRRFAALNLQNDPPLFVFRLRRDQRATLVIDGLGFGKSEDVLGPAIPTGDAAVEGLAENGIVRVLHDGGQPRRASSVRACSRRAKL